MLLTARERRILAPDEHGLQSRDQFRSEVQKLLGVLRTRVAQSVDAKEVRPFVLVQQMDARSVRDPGVDLERPIGRCIVRILIEQFGLWNSLAVALEQHGQYPKP